MALYALLKVVCDEVDTPDPHRQKRMATTLGEGLRLSLHVEIVSRRMLLAFFA